MNFGTGRESPHLRLQTCPVPVFDIYIHIYIQTQTV